jgi:hypothetical protein
MPRGPGTADTLKLPAGWPRTAPALVWSWHECPGHTGAWWVVDQGTDIGAARGAAKVRLANVTRGTTGDRYKGCPPIEARTGARFVATTRDGDPQAAWEALRTEGSTL